MFNERKFIPDQEEALFGKRSRFVLDNYPFEESQFSPKEIINSALDGFNVIENKGKGGEIESMISFDVNVNEKGHKYGEIGVMITREESRGEGKMRELFEKLKKDLTLEGCEYLTAKADTLGGKETLASLGFYIDKDLVNGNEYYRFDF